jgi:hypothetical protein
LPFVDDRQRHHKGAAPTAPSSTTTAPVSTGGNSTGGASSIDVTDSGVTYTMQVGVGNPATQFTLLIDTGQWNNSGAILRGSYISMTDLR